MSLASHPVAKIAKRRTVPAGELAFRNWAQNLPYITAALAANAHFLLFARIEYVVEFCTELVGTALFALFGGVADPAGSGRDGWPALGNGFTLAVLIYMTAKISGGKLNPAVSFALFMSGGLSLRVLISETVAQVAGAILGAALSRWFTHGTTLLHDAGVREFGCFGEQAVGSGISNAQVFAWECVCTFVLVSVVFATAVDDAAATHFVAIAPLAIGLSLFACAQASAPFTGGCLNPARFLGPAIVFRCGLQDAGTYIGGEMLGGALAGLLFRLRLRLQKETEKALAGAEYTADAPVDRPAAVDGRQHSM